MSYLFCHEKHGEVSMAMEDIEEWDTWRSTNLSRDEDVLKIENVYRK
jgi:hypothetical protein